MFDNTRNDEILAGVKFQQRNHIGRNKLGKLYNQQVNFKKINSKEENKDYKNYLNKMEILVINSITFKIPIQQVEHTGNEFYCI